MTRRGLALAGVAAAAAAGYLGYAGLARVQSARAATAHWQTIDRYCVGCHNGAERAGELALDVLARDHVAADAKIWEAVVRKLEAGLMPPPGEPRPSAVRIDSSIAWLTATLDAAAAANPRPGAPALHRLNRTEYANAVRDLLDLEVDATRLLPGDDSSAGFDNIAAALSVSPALMQAYVSAAAKISRLAIGDPTTSPGITTYTVPRDIEQADHVDGLPLGTRGGLLVDHVFPLDADYEIRVGRAGSGFGLRAVGSEEPVEITLNGERVALLEGRTNTAVLPVAAGPYELGVAMVAGSRPRGVDDLFSMWAAAAGVTSVSITGPLDPRGPGDTPSRRRVLICTPTSPEDETVCARRILATLATRAFRRPVAERGETLDTLMTFYETGRQARGFETGIQYALARVLVDPRFIFRFERESDDVPAGGVYALDGFELASRLSFFLWSSIPDDELLAAAAEGGLTDPSVRARQVRRMLADPKASALAENFATQWLGLQQLDTVLPATPAFDGNLRRSLKRETQLLFDSIVREDRSIAELLDADYTFVDERLARHYELPNVRGSRFRRIELKDDDARRGILGHGSVLTVTSSPTRTSPVIRGAWVLKTLLGTPPPSPPPGVETNLDESVGAGPLSLRERLERHRADPSCAVCHSMIDPLGFALENFDAIGHWREADGGRPVDASGVLWDGTPIDGPGALREALRARRTLFITHATEMLLTYALGRPLEPSDMPAVRRIVRGAEKDDYRFSALVLGIADSLPFIMKEKGPSRADASGG